MSAVLELVPALGVVAACVAMGTARASYYRALVPKAALSKRPAPPRALSAPERQQVLDVLHEARFVDLAPAEVYATLLDEQRYLCSERTMYRVLDLPVRRSRPRQRHRYHAEARAEAAPAGVRMRTTP